MEDLLIGRVRGCTDFTSVSRPGNILDVRDHRRRAILQSCVLLATTDASNMGRDAGVNCDVILTGIIIDTQAPENKEATTIVEVFR